LERSVHVDICSDYQDVPPLGYSSSSLIALLRCETLHLQDVTSYFILTQVYITTWRNCIRYSKFVSKQSCVSSWRLL